VTPESQVRFRTQGEAGPVAFLSPDECAQRAMLSRKVIYRAIEGGELLAFRVRARLRIPEEEFSRWMTADPVSRGQQIPRERTPTRSPTREGSFRSVLRTAEEGQA
jgi:excisionase family DNA binding protein